MDKFEQLKQLEKLKSLKTKPSATDDLNTDMESEADIYLKQAQDEIKYGDSELKTFGESALSSATLGLSDQAAVKLGLTTPEAIKARREYNPISNISGQVTGVIAPAIVSGGSSVAAKAASILPSSLAMKAGSTLTKSLASALKDKASGSIVKNIIQRSIPVTAGSAVEGAAFGLGELISENALGNKKFNAETALNSALYGAGTGALLGGSISAASGIAKPIKAKASEFVSKHSNLVDNFLDLSGASASKKAWYKSKYTPQDLENSIKNTSTILKNSGDLKVFKSTKSLADGYSRVKDKIGKEIGDIYDSIGDKGVKISRQDVLKSQINTLDDIIASKMKNPDFLKKIKEIEDIHGITSNKVNQKIRDLIDVPELKDDVIKLTSYRKNIQDAYKLSDGVMYNSKMLHDDITNIDDKLQSLYKSSDNDLTLQEEAYKKIRSIYKERINHLADMSIDPELASRLRKANKDYHDLSMFEREFMKKGEKSDGLLDAIAFKDAGLLTAGSILGIPDVAGIYVGVNKLLKADIMKRAMIMSGIEKSSKELNSKLKSSVSNFFKSSSKAAKPMIIKSLIKSNLSTREGSKPSDDNKAFNNIKLNIEELKSNPTTMINTVGKLIGPYQSVAPDTAAEMVQTFTRKIDYIQSKLPAAKFDNGIISKFKQNKEESISSIEMAKFKKIINTLEDPTSILEDLTRGTITRDQVEAIQVVYPSIYESMQDEVMKHISDSKSNIPYSKRINLGILLNIPTDRSITPEYIQQLQLTYANEASQQQETEGKYSALSLNDNVSTQVGKIEES